LVAKGYSQKTRINYNEIFSPVVKSDYILKIFPLVDVHNIKLAQFDVKTMFLNNDLDE
jgi:hypothetical protein